MWAGSRFGSATRGVRQNPQHGVTITPEKCDVPAQGIDERRNRPDIVRDKNSPLVAGQFEYRGIGEVIERLGFEVDIRLQSQQAANNVSIQIIVGAKRDFHPTGRTGLIPSVAERGGGSAVFENASHTCRSPASDASTSFRFSR
jgi:hypothetical protein